MLVTGEDLSYIAGVIDSDGYIGLVKQAEHRRKNGLTYGFKPTVVITQAQNDAITFINNIFPGGYRVLENPRKKSNWKNLYYWGIHRRELVRNFLCMILPYLKIKRKQAELIIQFCEIRERVLSDRSRLDKKGRPRRSSKYTYSGIERELWLQIKQLNQTGVGTCQSV